MLPAVEIRGKPASEGIFTGPVVTFDIACLTSRPARNAALERSELNSAIAAAIASITALASKNRGAAADILEFQIAMLQDDVLKAHALAAVDQGFSAADAWWTTVENEIAGYVVSADETFSAKAADLKDIRDRVMRTLAGETKMPMQSGSIFVGDDLPPTLFLETDWSQGGAIALKKGSSSSHVAMLARSRGVPMVIGLGETWPGNYERAIVDGTVGLVLASPSSEIIAAYARRSAKDAENRDADKQFLMRPVHRRDGTRVDVQINISSVEELDQIDPASCDGIGLMRSEFLFRDGVALPNEDEQYQAYRKMLEWAGGRPVTIRTLDVGGDKPLRGLTSEGKKNSFLGLRGIRLLLARPEVFRTQLRALVRAAIHGNLKIMLPMVTLPRELEQSTVLLDQCVSELQSEGKACSRPPLGIMVEVPAVAIAPELFAKAAFFSIGTNDLTQFVMASSRDETSASDLQDAAHPAIARLIAGVTAYGQANHIPVSLCGDMASVTQHLPLLMEAGVTSLSVAPAALARVKSALSKI
jgi:phosphoenolpyruvate-protein phosphotransferase (PTS system enzyme I)